MLPSRYLVGKDGQTPIKRSRGRKCGIEVIPFGETVWYKELRETKERRNQLESEFKEGIWLGHSRNSNEIIIGTPDGVVKAYSVYRKALGERWDKEKIKNVKGTPQQPNPNAPGLEIPIRIRFDALLISVLLGQGDIRATGINFDIQFPAMQANFVKNNFKNFGYFSEFLAFQFINLVLALASAAFSSHNILIFFIRILATYFDYQ